MAEQSLIRNIIKKGVVGVILGIVLVAVAKATHFPPRLPDYVLYLCHAWRCRVYFT